MCSHTILLVEDDEDFLKMFRRSLRRAMQDDVCLVSASTGPEAIRRFLRCQEIRLVVLDIHLRNRKDGIETAHYLLRVRKGTKIFGLTATPDIGTDLPPFVRVFRKSNLGPLVSHIYRALLSADLEDIRTRIVQDRVELKRALTFTPLSFLPKPLKHHG